MRHEIRDLYDEVADLLDDDRVEALPGYFVDDCVYRITTRENHDRGLPLARSEPSARLSLLRTLLDLIRVAGAGGRR